jgi:CheY-like chemotaxis protein
MKATILVIDDDEEMRSLLRFTLEREGYIITSISDGRTALNFLANFKPDLIIADLLMPEVSGIDLLKQLRSNSQFSNTPVIVISAFQSYLEEAKRSGATMMLSKPVDVLELPQIVSQLLFALNVT